MPTPPKSTAGLMALLRKSGVGHPEKLACVSESSLSADPQKAGAELVAQGIVTRFQAQQLLAGRHKGFRVGPYTILDMLGRGGMGAVYLGEHRDLQRKVAIKVLVPGGGDDQKLALERFQREARAAAALRASVARLRPSVCWLASQLRSARRSRVSTDSCPRSVRWAASERRSPV